jgi:hypothetical protein
MAQPLPITAVLEDELVTLRFEGKLLTQLLLRAIGANGHGPRTAPRPKATAKPKAKPKAKGKAWTPTQRRKFRQTMKAKRNGAPPSEPQALP